jgi:hypothetical protein
LYNTGCVISGGTDSTADLLSRIGADSSDAESNIQRFRAVFGKNFGEMGRGDLNAKFALFMGRGLRRKTRFSRGDQEEEGCLVALPIKLAVA